jgi:hypothetical protein
MVYRDRRLLELANECEICKCCGRHAPCVAAHSNQLRDGKGRGIKAHDYRIAYLCQACHREIDEGKGSREEKREKWEEAHRATLGWLFENGKLQTVS